MEREKVLDNVTQWADEIEASCRAFGLPESEIPQAVCVCLAQIHHESRGNPFAVNPDSGAAGLLQLLSSDLRDAARQRGGLMVAEAQIDVWVQTALKRRKQGMDWPCIAWAWASGPGRVKASIQRGGPSDEIATRQLSRYIGPLLSQTYRAYADWLQSTLGEKQPLARVYDGTFRWQGVGSMAYGVGDTVTGSAWSWPDGWFSAGRAVRAAVVAAGVLIGAALLKWRAA